MYTAANKSTVNNRFLLYIQPETWLINGTWLRSDRKAIKLARRLRLFSCNISITSHLSHLSCFSPISQVHVLEAFCHRGLKRVQRCCSVTLLVWGSSYLLADALVVELSFYVHGSAHRESMSIFVQQDATMYSLLYFYKLLYMFRVVTPPIIRSTYNCNYSIWHWSNRHCYLPLAWRSWNFVPTSPR